MKWLHVTDLHFGVETHESKKMLENLAKVAELTGSVDCLFITGDLRYAAKYPENYPPETETKLIELRKALGVPPERVFIVPGNHDVNSNPQLPGFVERGLKEYHTSGKGTVSPHTLSYLQGCQEGFNDLRDKIGRKRKKAGRKKDSPAIHYCVQLSDFPFNIICLNTALFCYYYQDEKGDKHEQNDENLILGKEHIDQMFKDEVDPNKHVIILAHHPLEGIDSTENRNVSRHAKRFHGRPVARIQGTESFH